MRHLIRLIFLFIHQIKQKRRWQDLNSPDQRSKGKGGFKSIQSEVRSDHTAIYAGKHNGCRTWAVGFGSGRCWRVAIRGGAAVIGPAAVWGG